MESSYERERHGKMEREDSALRTMSVLKCLLSCIILVASIIRLTGSDGIQEIPALIVTDQSSNTIIKSFATFSPSDQQSFLNSHGHLCSTTRGGRYSSSNPIIDAYKRLAEISQHDPKYGRSKDIQTDIWKLCTMAAGYASTYLNPNQVFFPNDSTFPNVLKDDARNIAIQTNLYGQKGDQIQFVNSAILSLGKTKSGRSVSMQMIQRLISNIDTPLEVTNYRSWKGHELFRLVKSASVLNPSEWNILTSYCVGLEGTGMKSTNSYSRTGLCTRSGGSPCCEITYSTDASSSSIFLMTHGIEEGTFENKTKGTSFDSHIVETVPEESRIPFEINGRQLAPRFFDVLLDNDCLPSYPCSRCFASQDGGDLKSQCSVCSVPCACYCKALCKIRPHTMKIVKGLRVKIPAWKRDPSRLIPRIVHQTYFEPVTKEKYPNFSRLVESWKQSGWDYKFYTDEDIELFLSSYFPSEVREAYDAIIPGAYKADLFRYCVLLIRGGLYADVDVLLSTDLDKLLQNDIGFMVPVDEPGRVNGAGSCLWNGLLATAPGHPFVARTIEMIVNNVRNRYTGVDIDDMLCPRKEHHRLPDLQLSHSFDLLYLTGPCIFGSSINDVLGRHMQTHISPGEMNIWNNTFISGTVNSSDERHSIPGRTIILGQNKNDMGAHRFTYLEKNMIVATTDMPGYDDRKDVKHYSDSKKENKKTLFGLTGIYKDLSVAHEMVKIVIEK